MHWFENEQFWVDCEPFLFDQEKLDTAIQEIQSVLFLLGVEDTVDVLDMPCGVGRHARELGKLGHRVTAVDRTAHYLERARASCAPLGDAVRFVQADMHDFCEPEQFDVVLNLYTSIGYTPDAGDDLQMLRNLARSLRPGGKLALDLTSREILARDWRERWWTEIDGAILLESRKLLDAFSRVRCDWTVIKQDSRASYHFEHRLFSATELTALVAEAGFREIQVYGNLVGDPYDQEAERLVLTATR